MPVYDICLQTSVSDNRCHVHPDCQACPELGASCWSSQHPHASQRSDDRGNVRILAECRIASTRYDYESRTDLPHVYTMSLTVAWEGRVVAQGVHQDQRVMSDVWDNVPYVIVRTGPGQYEEVQTYKGPGVFPPDSAASYALQGVERAPTVDAPEEHVVEYTEHVRVIEAARVRTEREAYEARCAAQEKARREAPAKGKVLRVVKGRKVPKGTEGVCIWIGSGAYGERVGIKDAKGEIHWTASSNVVAVGV